MPEIKINVNANSIKIFINDILHLAIKKDDLVGIQSWVQDNDERRRWHIHYENNYNRI